MIVVKETSQSSVQGASSVIVASSALAAHNSQTLVVFPPNPQGVIST
jgi:hypothetical protein